VRLAREDGDGRRGAEKPPSRVGGSSARGRGEGGAAQAQQDRPGAQQPGQGLGLLPQKLSRHIQVAEESRLPHDLPQR
jgi:hypothetical protein